MASDRNIPFRIGRVDIAKLDHLGPLMETCYGMDVPSRYFRWKYVDNPAGPVVGFEAYHEDRPVAFYGVIPEDYVVGGRPLKVHQAMDAMTHPDYQRKGLFVRLASLAYETVVREQGSLALIGVTAYHILPGHVQQLHSKHIHSFPYIFVPRELFSLGRLIRRPRGLTFQAITEVSSDLGSYFREREASTKPISPVLSADFLKWRLLDNPLSRYSLFRVLEDGEMVGFCAYEQVDRRCRVMVLDFKRTSLFRTHTGSAIGHIFDTTTCRAVFTWRPTAEEKAEGYRKAGMVRNPLSRGPFSFRIPFIVDRVPERVHDIDWSDIRNFDLQPIIQD